MGRKRLLTILAAVTTALSLQVGTAAAQISLPGIGDVNLGADECLEVGVDIPLTEALKLDPNVCLSEDGVEIEGGATALGQRVDVGEATQPVEDTTAKVADSVKSAKEASPTPTETPSEEPESPKGGDSDRSPNRSSGSSATGTKTTAKTPDVAAAGKAAERPERDAARDAQLGALRALRSDLAASSPSQRGIAGPVQTLGALSSTSDLAAPEVADAAPGEVVPGVDERLAPEVATSSESEEAVLATSSPVSGLAEAPIALQLLASALVLGAAAVWTIAARELGRDQGSAA